MMSTLIVEAGVLVVYEPERAERPRVITFKISPRELERLDRAARLLGVSRSELIRDAIRYYLEALHLHE